MKNESPIWLLLLRHQKERREKLHAKEENQQKTTDSMGNPYKHEINPFLGGYIKLKSKKNVKGKDMLKSIDSS
jgi:hypothetical protein